MWCKTYLIKQAVTTPQLAQIAKRFGIPFIGDWRYAARLKQKALKAKTDAGRRHYEKILGFTTPTERRVINRMAEAQSKSPQDMVRILEKLEPLKVQREALLGQVAQMMTKLKGGGSEPELFKKLVPLMEGGLSRFPGQRRMLAPGIPLFTSLRSSEKALNRAMAAAVAGGATPPIEYLQRSVHRHPSMFKVRELLGDFGVGPHRYSRFGRVTPSTPLDIGKVMSPKGVKSLQRFSEFDQKMKNKVPAMVDTGYPAYQSQRDKLQDDFMKYTAPEKMTTVPERLDDAVSLLKDYTQRGMLRPMSDTLLVSPNTPSTHAIFSNDAEAVMKGSRGAVKRLYYRDLPNT